jgi:hypothetical protein
VEEIVAVMREARAVTWRPVIVLSEHLGPDRV